MILTIIGTLALIYLFLGVVTLVYMVKEIRELGFIEDQVAGVTFCLLAWPFVIYFEMSDW